MKNTEIPMAIPKEKAITGLRRSLIVKDITKVDAALIDLAKSGRQVFQIMPIPHEIEIKEPVESWKEKEESSRNGGMEVGTYTMIIYLDPVFQDEWNETVKANVVKIEDIK